jgi:cytochrome c peroxidase
VKDDKQRGKFRTPTLRNVEFTAPYFHNGSAATLEDAVGHVLEHLQTKVTPEIKENLEQKYTGNITLSTIEKRQLIAFLKTLSDGYTKE